MPARGSAARSATGAAMSKYDVEVEARLQALEKVVAELKNHQHAAAPAEGGEDALLRKIVRAMEPNFDALVKKYSA
tara:strand:+ start:212 stop:439 length:228 start_codon:yes stop_codon:yes gene_type:complete